MPPRVNILPRPQCVSLWVLEGKFVEIIRFSEPNICLCFKGTPQANRDGAKQNTPESGVCSVAASLNLLFLRKGNLFKISFWDNTAPLFQTVILLPSSLSLFVVLLFSFSVFFFFFSFFRKQEFYFLSHVSPNPEFIATDPESLSGTG